MTGYQSYMQAFLWTCKTCGFVYEGGQPKQNCPSCEAYKTNFIDIPQHLEAQIREEFPDRLPNNVDCRKRRVELLKEHRVGSNYTFAGRVPPTFSGSNINPHTT